MANSRRSLKGRKGGGEGTPKTAKRPDECGRAAAPPDATLRRVRSGAFSVLAAVLVVIVTGCGGGDGSPDTTTTSLPDFELTVEAGDPGIDARFTCDGADVSPAASWRGVPDGTQELAFVMDDQDADGFTHWLVYSMPSGVTSLPEGVPAEPEVAGPTPLAQGENSFGEIGYGGPCPPTQESHTYRFQLVALDTETGLAPGADRSAFDAAVEGHLLAEATVTITYARP